jgi:hypothetical protein
MTDRKKCSRRQFLRKTAGAAAGIIGFPYLIPSSAVGLAGTVAPSNRLTVGCIGVGLMGWMDMKGFATLDETRVLGVCDVERAYCESAKNCINEHYQNKDCAGYNDFRELIARDDIDIIVNATPDHWHAIPSIMAMKAGKDVYCEKPLGLTIAEGQIMSATAKRYNAVTQINTWQRSIAKFQQAVKLVRDGYIGKVKTVKVDLPLGSSQLPRFEVKPVPDGFDYEMWLGQAPWAPYTNDRCRTAFRNCYDYSGGELTDWGAHDLDIAQWGMNVEHTGPVTIETKGTFRKSWVWNTPITFDCVCEYAEGFTLNIGTLSEEHQPGTTFFGSDGRWVHVTRLQLTTHPENLSRELGAKDKMLQDYVSGGHVENFLNGVKTRKKTIVPMEIAHRSISVAHLCNISLRLGRKLHWDPKNEKFVNDPEADSMLARSMRSPWRL